jgi:hypothetical protein
MKHFFATIWMLAAALTAAGETAQERGKRVVNEALEALGGKQFLAVQDRVESGRVYSFYRDELKGLSRATVYTRYLQAPVPGSVAQRERQSFGKEENSAVLFSDGKGYEITFRGARPLPDETIARYADSTMRNIFYILRMRLNEPGLVMESRGAEVEDNQPVEIVDITDAENRVVTVYFHRSTKLPVKQIYFRRDDKTRDRFEEVTVFSKYRDVGGGVQWPFNMERKRDGEKVFEIYSESVSINQGLTDNRFTLPGNIKILPKAR